MTRKLTITLSEAVYLGLHNTIGRRGISQFIEKLAAPHVLPPPASQIRIYSEAEIEESYRAMAADVEREKEAFEWCEALIGDACPDDDA